MKAFKYFSIAALTLFALASCAQKEVVEVGKPDLEGCQGVYFPAQLESNSITLDPTDPAELNIKISRKESKGAIKVPVVVTDTSEVFVVPEVNFADGQTEATFTVDFKKAKEGITYGITIAVDDPSFVSTYTTNPTSISFNITRIKWNDLGNALVREDIISSAFNVPSKYAEIEWNIYEREDKKGYYKLVGLYGTKMLAALWGNKYPEEEFTENVTTPGSVFYINATDPKKVIIPYQNLGCKISSDGELWGGSRLLSGKDISFGTLENGILTFPKEGLVIGNATKAFAYANAGEMFRVVLPGTVLVDYTLKIGVGENAADGNIPVTFSKGVDVKTIAYAAFEGKLDAEAIKSNVKKISKGEITSQKTEETSVALKFDKTGVYTLVAVALNDKDEFVNSAAADFGYIAAGEDVPVVLDFGLIVSDQFKPKGHTAENSIAFYINGKDIKELRLTLLEAALYESNPAAYDKAVLGLEPKDAKFLKAVNGDGASDLFTELNPGTEYVMLVAANNGYKTQVFNKKATTAGKPKMAYRNFSFGQLEATNLPAEAKGYNGTYNFYAKKITFAQSGKTIEPKRTFKSKVTVTTIPAVAPSTVDTVVLSGVFAQLASSLKVEDKFDVRFIYKSGLLYFVPSITPEVTVGSKKYYTSVEPIAATDSYGAVKNTLLAGVPEKGIVAFYPNPSFEEQYSLSFTGISVQAYTASSLSSESYAGSLSSLEAPLLVDVSTDNSGLAPQAASSTVALEHGFRYPEVLSISELISLYSEPTLGPVKLAGIKEVPVREVKTATFTVSKVNTVISRVLELRKDVTRF